MNLKFYTYKKNKIVLDWISICFCLLTIIIIFDKQNLLNLLIVGSTTILIGLRKINLQTWLTLLGLALIGTIMYFFNSSQKINLWNHLHELMGFNLFEHIIDFVNLKYESKAADFICLTIFNVKQDQGWLFYNNLNQLSIGHLAVVSGFHFSILFKLISKVFKKKLVFKRTFLILISIVLLYFQQMSYSIVISASLQVLKYEKFKMKDYGAKLSLIGSLLLAFYPHAINSFSFQLTMLARIGIIISYKLVKSNDFLSSILVTTIINLLIWPIIGNFSSFFSFWAFILSFLYSGLFIFNFIITLFLFPFYWLSDFFSWMFDWQGIIFRFFTTINFGIKITGFSFYTIYFYNFCMINVISQLISRRKNKNEKHYNYFRNLYSF